MDPISTNDDYYTLLGISQNASDHEIREAAQIKRHAAQYESDNSPDPAQRWEGALQLAVFERAEETLLDPALRQQHNFRHHLLFSATPEHPWVTLGISGSTPVIGDDTVLAVGLEEADAEALIIGAFAGPEPGILMSNGPEFMLVEGRSVTHYDMTGACHGGHPHVIWDPRDLPTDVVTEVSSALLSAAADPGGTWEPPEGIPLEKASLMLRPGSFTALPIICVLLSVAAGSGYGVRELMDWLSTGQLSDVTAAYRSKCGSHVPRFVTMVEDLLNGPDLPRQNAVQLAWRALAPIEEIERITASGQMVEGLNVDSCLSEGKLLAITVPLEMPLSYPTLTYVGIANTVLGLLLPNVGGARHKKSAISALCVWSGLPMPLEARLGVAGVRTLVLNRSAAHFASWASAESRYDILLSPQAEREAIEIASARVGSDLPSVEAGHVLLIRNSRALTLSSPSVGGLP